MLTVCQSLLRVLHTSTHFLVTITLWGRYFYVCYFTVEETQGEINLSKVRHLITGRGWYDPDNLVHYVLWPKRIPWYRLYYGWTNPMMVLKWQWSTRGWGEEDRWFRGSFYWKRLWGMGLKPLTKWDTTHENYNSIKDMEESQ